MPCRMSKVSGLAGDFFLTYPSWKSRLWKRRKAPSRSFLLALNLNRAEEGAILGTTDYHCCCSVTKSCPTLCNPMNCSRPGFSVLHYLLDFSQIRVHWVGDAIQPSHPLPSPSSPPLNFSQHQGLFQWVSSSHQVAKVLEFQLQHQSFQRTLRTDIT